MSCPIGGWMRIRYCFLVLLSALALAAGGCSQTEEAVPLRLGTAAATGQTAIVAQADSIDQVVVLTASAPTTLDPFYVVSVHPGDSIAAHLWDTLVWLDEDLE